MRKEINVLSIFYSLRKSFARLASTHGDGCISLAINGLVLDDGHVA